MSSVEHPPTPHQQRIARLTGVLLIITFITSIPALSALSPLCSTTTSATSSAPAPTRACSFGAFLELLLIIANIGTAVVPFPILKRQNESLALGYVTARVMESVFIAVGILSVLAVVTLAAGRGGAGADRRARGRPVRSSRSRTGRSCSGPASSSASGTG